MVRGIICCTLGVLTFGLGLKQFWDMKESKEPAQEETPAAPAPKKDEVIDTTAVAE